MKIGVNRANVYNWESARVATAVRSIPKIIQFLGYSPYVPALSSPRDSSCRGKLKVCRRREWRWCLVSMRIPLLFGKQEGIALVGARLR
jgi:hypothetical protein